MKYLNDTDIEMAKHVELCFYVVILFPLLMIYIE